MCTFPSSATIAPVVMFGTLQDLNSNADDRAMQLPEHPSFLLCRVWYMFRGRLCGLFGLVCLGSAHITELPSTLASEEPRHQAAD